MPSKRDPVQDLFFENHDNFVHPGDFQELQLAPLWLETVAQIMEKAQEHHRAGRHSFTQVLVDKENYEALVEYFDGDDSPVIMTVIGPINVYPANPDGCTFVD
jgi:hypothetical protein